MAKSDLSPGQKIFGLFNPRLFLQYQKRVKDDFGFKFFLLLSSVYYGIKGAGYYFAKDALLPYTEDVGIGATDYQLNATIGGVPWSIKAFIGVISDCFPLFGFYKTSYMIIFCILGSTACFILIVLPASASQVFALTPGVLIFWIHFEGSATDLLAEGKYVSKMRELPHTKGDVVTYVWWCQTFGQIVPSFTVGTIADATEARYIYIIALPFLVQPLIFLFMGCMVDDRAPPGKANKWDSERWYSQWKMMTFAVLFGLGVLMTVPLAIIPGITNLHRFIYALIISAIFCTSAFFVMKNVIARANLYIFIIRWLYLNLTGGVEKWYVASPECVPDGPHFSMVFFKTYTAIAATICGFIGLYFFQVFVQHWNFRPAFWVTTVMRAVASMFDFIIIMRWNKAIGIPDWVLYLVGNAVILETVYMMDFMPMNLIIAKLCPRHVESTMYAILAGFMNFGSSLGSYTGLVLLDLFGIDSLTEDQDGTPCNFDNLHWLVFLGHFITPLLAIPLTFILIPNAYVTDDVITLEQSFKATFKLKKKVDTSLHVKEQIQQDA